MEKNMEYRKFVLVKDLAQRINSSVEINQTLQHALDGLLDVVKLQCASVALWNEKTRKLAHQMASGSIEKVKILRDFDQRMIETMREQIRMESVYATFDSEGPHSVFSYPIRRNGSIVGAIAGLVEGYRNLSANEDLFEALSHLIGLAFTKASLWREKIGGEIQEDLVKSERLNAIVETAVTINHEINNPLAAVLGYAQLLLSRPENLDQDTVDKVKKIETGALRIKEVTNRLLKIVEPVVVKYAGEIRMVDLDQSKTQEDKAKDQAKDQEKTQDEE